MKKTKIMEVKNNVSQVYIDLLNQALKDGLVIITSSPDGEKKVTGAISTEDEIILYTE